MDYEARKTSPDESAEKYTVNPIRLFYKINTASITLEIIFIPIFERTCKSSGIWVIWISGGVIGFGVTDSVECVGSSKRVGVVFAVVVKIHNRNLRYNFAV